MKKQFSIFFFLFIVFSLQAQKIRSFSPDSLQFINELYEMMGELKPREGEALVNLFRSQFNNPKTTEEHKKWTYRMANKMLNKKMRPWPDFENFLYCHMGFVNSKYITKQGLENWKTGAEYLLENNSTFTKISSFYQITLNLFNGSFLYKSPSVEWSSNKPDYFFAVDFDKKEPKISFKDVNLKCSARNEESVIYNTEGVYYPASLKFYGYGGKVTFQRAGFAADSVYVNLANYELDVSKLEYSADSVVFFNKKYFSQPLFGKFSDKLLANMDETNASYPRFDSYQKVLTIKNLLSGFDYTGSFSFYGNKFIGKGTKEFPANITYKLKDTTFFKATSVSFSINESTISAENARISMYLYQDSIYHPGLQFRYVKSNNQISLYRDKKGISKSPYYNSFHKLEMDFEYLLWNLNQPMIDFSASRGVMEMKNQVLQDEQGKASGINQNYSAGGAEIMFRSNDFFHTADYDRLTGLNALNPLLYIYDGVEHFKSKTLNAVDVAKYKKIFMQDFDLMLLDLAHRGFINYDYDNKIIQVNEKLYHYIFSKAKRRDYDQIIFKSNVSEARQAAQREDIPNATLSLLNYDLKVRGVEEVLLSDSSQVLIRPAKEEMIIKKNRFFKFAGTIEAGMTSLYGKELEFDWENFKINLKQVDSLALYVKSETPDERGRYKFERVKNTINDIKGQLFIDNPGNKSGIKQTARYPYLASEKDSYVNYEKRSIFNRVYKKDRFYFKIDPFELDSLDRLSKDDAAFDGLFVSADIFPDFRETIKIMPDNSLGFTRQTPAEGFPIYKEKASYENTITLSNKGLRGNGILKYLNSTTWSKDFFFFPDSTNCTSTQYHIDEKGPPVEYPLVDGTRTYNHFMPYRDYMKVTRLEEPIQMFREQATMYNSLYMQPTGLVGVGLMKILKYELESNLMRYNQNEIFADTSDFRYKAPDDDVFGFKSNNVNAHVDFIKREGLFKSNGGKSLITLAKNKYICLMDEFTWYMDNDDIELRSKDTAKYEDPTQAGINLSGTQFISTHPDQDSLSWYAGAARYSVRNNIIYARDVPYIPVADAFIFADSNKVTVEKNAYMRPLANSRIIANTITRYHTIYNANTEVKGRLKYGSAGYKDYEDADGKKQTIYFDEITVDTSRNTIGNGKIGVDANFTLSPQYRYKGNVYLNASVKELTFDGFAYIEHTCDKAPRSWIKFKSLIDPANIYIPIADEPENDDQKKIYAGSLITVDSTHVYSAFLTLKKNYSDATISKASGFLNFDKTNNEFKIAQRAKLDEFNQPGNYIAFNPGECKMYSEGKLGLGVDLGQLKLNAAGNVKHDMNDNSLVFDMIMGINFFFAGSALDDMADEIEKVYKNAESKPVKIDRPVLEKGLGEIMGKTNADKTIANLNLYGNYRRFPDELKFTIFLTDLKMKYVESAKVFRSLGDIGLGNIEKKEFHKMVNGKLQVKKKKTGDEFDLYFEFEGGRWYYFSFKRNVMRVISSNEKFNNAIGGLKSDKRKMDVEKGQKPFSFELGNERAKKDFLKKFDSQEEEKEEEDKKKRR